MLFLASAALLAFSNVGHGASLPHILYIMADDVGWHDVSWHNPDMHTPNLHAMLKDGIELDRLYMHKYCSPSRAALLTGRLPIHNTQINDEATMRGQRYLVGADARMTMLPKKLAAAGYVSYQVGKWHLGGYTMHQIPISRGFNTSFGFLSGGEDHYMQIASFEAFYTPTGKPQTGVAFDLWRDNGPAYHETGTYNAFSFTAEAVKRIEEHDVKVPMFMYLAFQNAHCPLEVPERFQNKSIANDIRRKYHGMVSCLDESVGNVTAALKKKGMWDRTWVFFSSDNGGPIHSPVDGCSLDRKQPGMTGGNNYPLRGGKMSEFEGGVRVVAFAGGGAVPSQLRGQSRDGMMHGVDLHATICTLAGVSIADTAASIADVPDVDGMNMLPYLLGQAEKSPRTELMLGWWGEETVMPTCIEPCEDLVSKYRGGAIIVGDYKYITGFQMGMSFWTGPEHPNETLDAYPVVDCMSSPCLFNIREDPTEHKNLAAERPDLLASLEARLKSYLPGFFQSTDYGSDDGVGCVNEWTVVLEHRGFLAPMCGKRSSSSALFV